MKKYLFTTLFTNDLGLLTRSLPIARELRDRGHQIAYCNSAEAPSKLISDAAFINLLPSGLVPHAFRFHCHPICLHRSVKGYGRSSYYYVKPIARQITLTDI